MFELTIKAETWAELQQKLGLIYGSNTPAAAPPKAATPPKASAKDKKEEEEEEEEEPKSPPAEGPSSTPDQAKVDDEAMPQADFVKYCIDNSLKFHKDDGAALKAIWADLGLKDADGKPVERLGAILPQDYAAVIAAVDAGKI